MKPAFIATTALIVATASAALPIQSFATLADTTCTVGGTECEALGPNWSCDPRQLICVEAATACVVDADCANLGPDFVCDTASATCVQKAGPECTLDTDCEEGFVCLEDKCVEKTPEPTPCTQGGAECDALGPNWSCVNDVCVEKTPEPECTLDTDCEEGFVCVEDKCVEKTPEPTPCTQGGAECEALGPNWSCVNDVCVETTPEPECTLDTDCEEGFVCVEDKCVEKTPEPTPCTQGGAECDALGPNWSCVNDVCVEKTPEPECTLDTDCEEGFVCVEDKCVEPTPEPTPCTQGGAECEALGPNWSCVNDVCVETTPEPECTLDTDCEEGFVCVEDKCVEPTPECTVDTDCDEGFSCVEDKCVVTPPECTVDTDCAEGFSCIAGKCETTPPQPECTKASDCGDAALWECKDEKCVEKTEPQIPCTTDEDCGDVTLYECKENFCAAKSGAALSALAAPLVAAVVALVFF